MKTESQQNSLLTFLQSIGLPCWIADLSATDIVKLCAILLVTFFAATSAFTFGIILNLPWALVQLIDKQTLLYLFGDLSFIFLVGLMCFKLSRMVVIGLYFLWIFMVVKFCLGRRFPRGIRSPEMVRYQRLKQRAFIKNRKSMIVGGQSVLTLLLIYLVFFRQRHDSIIVPETQFLLYMMYTIIPAIVLLAIFGILSAHNVSEKIPIRKYLLSADGRPVAVTILLIFFVGMGFFRAFAMTEQIPLSYQTDNGICQLSSMFPVKNGHLYYEWESGSYVVLGNGGQNLFWKPYANLASPQCL